MIEQTPSHTQDALRELADSLAEAKEWDFDLPTDLAYERAENLIREIGRISPGSLVDPAVAESGDIELTIVHANELITLMIPYSGKAAWMAVVSLPDRNVLSIMENADSESILHRIEQSAAA